MKLKVKECLSTSSKGTRSYSVEEDSKSVYSNRILTREQLEPGTFVNVNLVRGAMSVSVDESTGRLLLVWWY